MKKYTFIIIKSLRIRIKSKQRINIRVNEEMTLLLNVKI